MIFYVQQIIWNIYQQPEVVSTLKRTANAIFDKGGFIRKIDNLGKLATPYRIPANNQTHKEAK